jgi:DNA invertase Pin-like site-specific DNA recombinase
MAPLVLSPRQRSDLEHLAARNPVAKERCRAQALLWLDEGESSDQVAEPLRVSRRTVYYWAERFRDRDGLDPVHRLPLQLSAMREHAERRGWTVVIIVEDVGPGVRERPKRDDLIRAARRRELDLILVWRLDRWGRSLVDLVTTLQELTAL